MERYSRWKGRRDEEDKGRGRASQQAKHGWLSVLGKAAAFDGGSYGRPGWQGGRN